MVTSAALRLFGLVNRVRSRLEDEHGQTLAEYGLIVTTIAVAVVILAVIVFRDAVVGSFQSASHCLNGSC